MISLLASFTFSSLIIKTIFSWFYNIPRVMTPEVRLAEVLFNPRKDSSFKFANAILDRAYKKNSIND